MTDPSSENPSAGDPDTENPANSLLTPLAAVATTLAGLLVLLYANSELAVNLIGGAGAVCRAPDCVLGAGVWLIAGGFLLLCAAMVVSVVLALRRRHPTRRVALRRGLFVGLWCLLAYLVESIVIWILF